MVQETFKAAFDTMAAQLAEMQKARQGSTGIIEAKTRGRLYPVTIARAEPGAALEKQYKETAAGLVVIRPSYSELVPYWDIYTLTAVIYGPPCTD
ncbi:MAG: hypothetical protein IJV01_00005 [Bacteroidales bacterium]|jgi:hypothetical protein|nr:hypothetical protein [Bacteroidales bacterium]